LDNFFHFLSNKILDKKLNTFLHHTS